MNSIFIRQTQLLFSFYILIATVAQAQQWQPVGGEIPGVTYTGIAADLSSPAIVAATLQSGIFRSHDSGETWKQVYTTEDRIYSLINIDGKHFCAGGKGFTYTSADSGVTWTAHVTPFPVAIGRLALHPSGVVIAGTGSKWDLSTGNIGMGVWISTDLGISWSALNNGITKQDPLIEALAVTASGTILAGIYDNNVGLSGKHGLMKLESLQETWQRIPVSVDAPFNQHYEDQNLRIGSVFNFNIEDGQVLASIEGAYVNFGYAFTIQKPVGEIDNQSAPWKVKWVLDSIPGAGSFYEHITNLFKDSHDTIWASVSGSGNEINNNIFIGPLTEDIPWTQNIDNISEQTGRFLFAEGVNERLYAVSYFTGNQIFVRENKTTSVSEEDNRNQNQWALSPNPTDSYIHLSKASTVIGSNIHLRLYDVIGNKIMEQKTQVENEISIQLDNKLPDGLYFMSIWDGRENAIIRVVKN